MKYIRLKKAISYQFFMDKGLPDEFIKFANDKFIEIQEAYDQVKKEKGA